LSSTPGVIVQDDPSQKSLSMPRNAEGKDEVFVGRIRRDESREKCLNMWIVSDNLRKGRQPMPFRLQNISLIRGCITIQFK